MFSCTGQDPGGGSLGETWGQVGANRRARPDGLAADHGTGECWADGPVELSWCQLVGLWPLLPAYLLCPFRGGCRSLRTAQRHCG